MNLKELKEIVDSTYEELNGSKAPENISVVIPLAMISVGARRAANVTSVTMGFDWEAGRLNIGTDSQLVTKGSSKEDIVPAKTKVANYYSCGRKRTVRTCSVCGSKVRKDDTYCFNCGQRMK